jgi:ATP-dependent Clp protease protease subunit
MRAPLIWNSKRAMPLISNFEIGDEVDFGARADQVERWNPAIHFAQNAQGETVIEIYDTVGRDPFFGGGVGSVDVANALKGAGDVQVNVNSPGGLFSEGNAIYNLLVQHPGKVTVNMIQASSAAALLSMAGDQVNIAPTGFFFIHNAQALAFGDRNDFTAVAKDLGKLDDAILSIYAARSNAGKRQIGQWLDEATTFSAKEAVNAGFADAIMQPGDLKTTQARNDAREMHALRYTDAALAEKGLTRAKRREVLNAIKAGKPIAAHTLTHDAGLSEVEAALVQLRDSL